MPSPSSSSRRFRPLDAVLALRALLRDPDDTGQVFKIISALSGGTQGRILGRLRATPVGQRVLRERPELATSLADRAHLRTLPEGSLGREYLKFCERYGITADGLVAASREGEFGNLSADELLVHSRMRDAHDLWHVVTGYQTDLAGEASVLAFTVAQTGNPGVALIVLLAYLRPHGEHSFIRKLLLQSFLRGRRAAWLPAADWEGLLARPLEEVRRELRVGAPPSYKPVWPHEIFSNKKPPAPPTAQAA